MSKIYKQITWRKTKEEILYLYNRLSNVFSNYIIKWTNKLPELYKDKKDFWDIDFFWQLKDDVILTGEDILEIMSNNWFIVWKELKDTIINNFSNIEKIEKTPVIYKNDIEYTLLAYDIETDQYFHIDLNLINEKKDWVIFKYYFEYYRKPFFSYHLWIILRKFWIKYSSKGVFYRIPQEIFWQDINLLITKDLYSFLEWINFWLSDTTFLDSYNNISENNDIIDTITKLYIFDYRFFNTENLKYEEKRKIKSYKINEKLNNLILENKKNNIENIYAKLYLNKNIEALINEKRKLIIPELKDLLINKEQEIIKFYKSKFEKSWLNYNNINIQLVPLFVLYSLLLLYPKHNIFQIELLKSINNFKRKDKEQKFKKELYNYLFWDNYWKELAEIYKNREKNKDLILKLEEIISNFEDYCDDNGIIILNYFNNIL